MAKHSRGNVCKVLTDRVKRTCSKFGNKSVQCVREKRYKSRRC